MSPYLLASKPERRTDLLPYLHKLGLLFLIVCFVLAPSVSSVNAKPIVTAVVEGNTYDDLIISAGDPALVGYWKFNEGSGTTAIDSSGKGNNGTISYFNTAPTYESGPYAGKYLSKFSTALQFDPLQEHYVQIASNATLRPMQYTLAMWFYWTNPTLGNDKQYLTGKKTGNYEIYTEDTAGENGLVFVPAGSGTVINATGALTSGAWNHIVVTYDSAKLGTIYVNGVEKASATVAAPADLSLDNRPFYLGMRSDYTGFLKGNLDEVRFYNKPLSAPEVTNLYNDSCVDVTCLTGDVTVTGTLTLNGVLSLGNYNLTLGPAATISGDFSSSKMIVADGTGTLTKQFGADSTFTFPVGDSSGNYSPATITLNGASYPSSLSTSIVTGIPGGLGVVSNYIKRTWRVVSSGLGTTFTANLNFTYVDRDVIGSESLMKGVKNSGTGWVSYGMLLPAANTFIGTVNSFSDFTAASGQPTSVSMGGFSAESAGDGVLLSWQAGVETGLVGFNVYRADSPDAEPVQINSTIIPAGQLSYSYPDTTAEIGPTYTYWVEVVGDDGQKTLSAPISAWAGYRTFLPTTFRK